MATKKTKTDPGTKGAFPLKTPFVGPTPKEKSWKGKKK
jgi:hypothetical protein